jgi:polyisoprenoid-binding protein YceI
MALSSTSTLYRIVPEESEVRFLIGEFLDEVANQVIGATDQVAGDILIDFGDPAASRLGQIRVNVRTLETDQGMRDRTIRSMILDSGQEQYEFVEFDPIELVGLPDSMAVGDTMDFQIMRNLTVKGIAAAITFEATVTVVAADRIEGTARGSVRYDEYGLFIPNARGRVTNVDEVVVLEIDFVAVAVTG